MRRLRRTAQYSEADILRERIADLEKALELTRVAQTPKKAEPYRRTFHDSLEAEGYVFQLRNNRTGDTHSVRTTREVIEYSRDPEQALFRVAQELWERMARTNRTEQAVAAAARRALDSTATSLLDEVRRMSVTSRPSDVTWTTAPRRAEQILASCGLREHIDYQYQAYPRIYLFHDGTQIAEEAIEDGVPLPLGRTDR